MIKFLTTDMGIKIIGDIFSGVISGIIIELLFALLVLPFFFKGSQYTIRIVTIKQFLSTLCMWFLSIFIILINVNLLLFFSRFMKMCMSPILMNLCYIFLLILLSVLELLIVNKILDLKILINIDKLKLFCVCFISSIFMIVTTIMAGILEFSKIDKFGNISSVSLLLAILYAGVALSLVYNLFDKIKIRHRIYLSNKMLPLVTIDGESGLCKLNDGNYKIYYRDKTGRITRIRWLNASQIISIVKYDHLC